MRIKIKETEYISYISHYDEVFDEDNENISIHFYQNNIDGYTIDIIISDCKKDKLLHFVIIKKDHPKRYAELLKLLDCVRNKNLYTFRQIAVKVLNVLDTTVKYQLNY